MTWTISPGAPRGHHYIRSPTEQVARCHQIFKWLLCLFNCSKCSMSGQVGGGRFWGATSGRYLHVKPALSSQAVWGYSGALPLKRESVQGVGMLQSTTSSRPSSSSSPAAPGSCLRGPCVLLAGLLRDCVVGLLSFMAAAVNMTGCLETICFQWLPHGNRELNLRRARRLSRRQQPPSPRAVLQGW